MKTLFAAMTSSLLMYCIVTFILGALCWPYTLNFWLVFAHKPPAFLWWQGGLMGMIPFVGQFSLPAVIITFIASFFL